MNYEHIPFNYNRAEKLALRTKDFYDGKNGNALIHIKACGDFRYIGDPIPPLNALTFPQDMEKYLDFRAELDYQYHQFHERFDDDYIHSTAPWYGIAEHTAFLGGKVTFTADTTFQHKICENLEDFKTLRLDRENFWIKLVVDGIAYMREKWGEYIPVRMRGADGPSDFANAIREEDIFYDIYDEPDMLNELMKFCVKAMNYTIDLQKAEATQIAGGYITGFNVWLPGNCIGHISEDFSTMISTDLYEEHFLPHLKKAVSKYDIAILHTHSVGHRMLPLFAQVEKIKLLEIGNDPNAPRAVEILRSYRETLEDKITIITDPTYEEILSFTDILETNKIIILYHSKNEEDAKRAIAAIEKYR